MMVKLIIIKDSFGLFYVALFEFFWIVTGFDIFLVDILFGFFIRPYSVALGLLFTTKMTGKYNYFINLDFCVLH